MSHFIDEAALFVEAGKGGDGCSSFRREKYVPRGGPDGGDGGRGGSVILVGDRQHTTLLDLRHLTQIRAEPGVRGRNKNQTGANAADLLIKVPLGTLAFDEETGELLGEVLKDGDRLVVAKGGRGGWGNARFVGPSNRTPKRSNPGLPGESRRLKLELKLLADIGLVGYPNVGKSTLISACSSARPKIADYPFTTLVPHLGVAETTWGRTFVMADIPGLIEGAHTGAGLGLQFLRHIERCAMLLHVLEISAERGGDPLTDFKKIGKELSSFAPHLLDKPQCAVLNKMDCPADPGVVQRLRRGLARRKIPLFLISAATGKGTRELIDFLGKELGRLA